MDAQTGSISKYVDRAHSFLGGEDLAFAEADVLWRTLKEVNELALARMVLQRMQIGLALSGGGFRASFFHLGVLAFLAERNVLRNIEVLGVPANRLIVIFNAGMIKNGGSRS
jgi:hypothetical protein